MIKDFKFDYEDDLLIENFETGFDDDLEAILGADFIGMVTILPAEFGDVTELENQDDNRFDVFPRQECLFLDEDSNDNMLFERPNEVMKAHLLPPHIKANISGKMVNCVLVDRGAAINLLPESMLIKFGKIVDQLIKSNIVVTDFIGKISISKGMIMLDVRVGSIDRITPFVVVTSKARYTTLLGKE